MTKVWETLGRLITGEPQESYMDRERRLARERDEAIRRRPKSECLDCRTDYSGRCHRKEHQYD